MNTTHAKSPDKDDTAEMPVVTSNTVITAQYAAYIASGKLEAGLRKRTLLDDRYYHSLVRTVLGVPNGIIAFAEELGYPEKLVDNELIDFLYHSSQVVKSVGVEYVVYGDDWETIKRKYVAYISTPGIDDLWAQINKAINALERSSDPITAPGVVSSNPK